AAAGGEGDSVTESPFRQQIDAVFHVIAIDHGPGEPVAGPKQLIVRIAEVEEVGLHGACVVKVEHARGPGNILAVCSQKKSLKGGNRTEAAMELPITLTDMHAPDEKPVDSEWRVVHHLVDKGVVALWAADLVGEQREAHCGFARAGRKQVGVDDLEAIEGLALGATHFERVDDLARIRVI